MPRRRPASPAMICLFSLVYLSVVRAARARGLVVVDCCCSLWLGDRLVQASHRKLIHCIAERNSLVRSLRRSGPAVKASGALHLLVAIFLGGLLQLFSGKFSIADFREGRAGGRVENVPPSPATCCWWLSWWASGGQAKSPPDSEKLLGQRGRDRIRRRCINHVLPVRKCRG